MVKYTPLLPWRNDSFEAFKGPSVVIQNEDNSVKMTNTNGPFFNYLFFGIEYNQTPAKRTVTIETNGIPSKVRLFIGNF